MSLQNLVVDKGPSAFEWGDYNWLPTGHATRPSELAKAADFVDAISGVAPSLYVDFKDLRDVLSDLENEYKTLNAKSRPDFARSKAERGMTILHHARRLLNPQKLEEACGRVTKLQARRLLQMLRPADQVHSAAGEDEPYTPIPTAAPRTPPKASVAADSDIPFGYSPASGKVDDPPSPLSASMQEAIKRFEDFGHSPGSAKCYALALLGPPVPASKKETKTIAKAFKSGGPGTAKKPATKKTAAKKPGHSPMPPPAENHCGQGDPVSGVLHREELCQTPKTQEAIG